MDTSRVGHEFNTALSEAMQEAGDMYGSGGEWNRSE